MRGSALLVMPQPRPHDAETCFIQSLDWGRRQGARSWELRTAVGLAALWAAQGQRERAQAVLQPIFKEFEEGSDTADVKAAEYGSNRIAGIYSPGPPYTETPLPCCLAADNSADAWKGGILRMAEEFPALGNSLAEHPAFAERRPDILATRFLTLLVRIHDLPGQPVRFRAVATPPLFRNLERGLRKIRAKLRSGLSLWRHG